MDHVDRVCPLDGIGISTAWIMLLEPAHWMVLGLEQHGSC